MTWLRPSEAAKRLGIRRQSLHPKLPLLEAEGVARRNGREWEVRAEGLELAYDAVTRARSDSPRRQKGMAGGGAPSRRPPAAQPAIPGTDVPSKSPPAPGHVDERAALLAQLRGEDLPPGTSRTEAERIRAIAQARLYQLDVEDREGRLVDAEAVGRQWFEAGRRVRDQVLSLPARISADLAAEVDPVKVAILLEKELTQCLEAMGGPV